MPKKIGISGFNSYMSKPTRPAGPAMAGNPILNSAMRLQNARASVQGRASDARAVNQARAAGARATNQGRVAAAMRKAAQRGRGRVV